jgi:hypothetical protein
LVGIGGGVYLLSEKVALDLSISRNVTITAYLKRRAFPMKKAVMSIPRRQHEAHWSSDGWKLDRSEDFA